MKRFFLFLFVMILSALAQEALASAKKEVAKGNVLYHEGRFEDAMKHYEEALTEKPDSDIVNFNLGTTLYKTKDYEASIGQFEKTLVSEDQLLEQKASYNIANAKYKHGIGFEHTELEQAIEWLKQSLRHYERALEIEAEDEDTKLNYEFVKKELERLQKQQQQQQQDQNQQGSQGQQQQKNQDKQDQQDQQEQRQDQQEQQQEKENEQEQKDDRSDQNQDDQKDNPQDQQDQEQSSQGRGSRGNLSEQEALMLLENYSQEEEPKGMYREKIDTSDMLEVLKDW